MADPTLDILTASSGSTPVAAGGTITFQYPAGRARAVYMWTDPAVLGVRSSQAIYNQDTDFTVAFNAANIVVTFLGVIPIAANTPVSLQLPIRDTSGAPVARDEYGVSNDVFPSGL